MLEITGLLQERELDTYEFSHLTFQEYFAVLYLKDLGNEGQAKVIERLGDKTWEEVIYFYMSLADANPIITAILKNPNYNTLYIANQYKSWSLVTASIREKINDCNKSYYASHEDHPLIFYDQILALTTLEKHFNNLTAIDEKRLFLNP